MKIKILKLENGFWKAKEDTVISEHSFTLFGNGEKLGSFHCTPSDLEELAAGALFTMGKISCKEDVLSLRIASDGEKCPSDGKTGYVRFRTEADSSGVLEEKASGTLETAFSAGRRMTEAEKLLPEDIFRMMEENLVPTPLFQETGGVHMASLYRLENKSCLCKKEDAARHNAVDKVIGAALLQGISMKDTCLVVSGRISGEILDKAVLAGIPVVLSKAAPTAQSVEKAKSAGITLIGFIRNQRMNVYTHPWRLALPDEVFRKQPPAAVRRL